MYFTKCKCLPNGARPYVGVYKLDQHFLLLYIPIYIIYTLRVIYIQYWRKGKEYPLGNKYTEIQMGFFMDLCTIGTDIK